MPRRVQKTTKQVTARLGASAPKTPTSRPAERLLVVTTVRVYRDQLQRLHEMALARRFQGGHTGRGDASAILRELLDTALSGVR